jgi:hypothetical protein
MCLNAGLVGRAVAPFLSGVSRPYGAKEHLVLQILMNGPTFYSFSF